jgi:putative FmdB family regulatory protein
VPLYEYQCKKCKHRFEKIQQFSDAPIKKCPECGGAVEKLLSAPVAHFKGSGWYVTDYARKSDGASSSTENSKSEAAKTDSSNADAGSATKAVEKSENSGKEKKSKPESRKSSKK